MNPLFALFGFLGAIFALGGKRSNDTDDTEQGAEVVTDVTDEVEEALEIAETVDEDEDVESIDYDQGGEPIVDVSASEEDAAEIPEDIETVDQDVDHDHGADHDMSDDDNTITPEGYVDITAFGTYHNTSMHTDEAELEGGRTAITTEAHVAYNALRDFLELDAVELETVGEWAFENDLTNNDEAFGGDLEAVGLFYSMQGAKVGWIDDDSFDPQILADIQRTARLGEPEDVMDMVEIHGHDGFAAYLEEEGLTETFVNTLKMEPHYGGIMHGRTHGDLEFEAEPGAEHETPMAHDLNHLTVLSHDQTQPFMNDTFDWPQWPALDASQEDVLNYFQSMVTLGDPHGEGITADQIETDADAMSEGESLMALLATDTVLDEIPPSSVEMNELCMEI